MGDEAPPSPPLPRGSYNIDFDKLDLDAIDPFKSSKGLAQTPSEEVNPFQPKKKLASSPPLPRRATTPIDSTEDGDACHEEEDLPPPPPDMADEDCDYVEEEPEASTGAGSTSEPIDIQTSDNPFQPKSILGHSPPSIEDENPFKPKTKLAQSPPSRNGFSDDIDPFKGSSKLGHSPSNGANMTMNNEFDAVPCVSEETVETNVDNGVSESPRECNATKGLKTKAKTKSQPSENTESQEIENAPEKPPG